MKTDSAILTIAIPTCNRAAKVQAQLERLLPQLRPEIRICIYDNASTDGTREAVEPYLARGVSYFRAAANCGVGRNFFRCFEECQTEWIWVLGDDDPVLEHAVEDLLPVIQDQSCDFIHTSNSTPAYAANTVVSDLESLFKQTTFRSSVFISAGVYRIPSFRPFFFVFNESISTWCPQLLMVLSLLGSRKGKVLLSSIHLLGDSMLLTPTWPALNCLVRLSFAPEYLVRPEHQKIVADRILLEWFDDLMLFGLRETAQLAQVRRWQRIQKQASSNLKAYRGRRNWGDVLANWYRGGQRKKAARIVTTYWMIKLLGSCPAFLFHPLAQILPLPKPVRDDYNNRNKYAPSC